MTPLRLNTILLDSMINALKHSHSDHVFKQCEANFNAMNLEASEALTNDQDVQAGLQDVAESLGIDTSTHSFTIMVNTNGKANSNNR